MTRCECRGELEVAVIESFDLSSFAGIPAKIENARGLRCNRCGAETLLGGVIAKAMDDLLLLVVRQPTSLAVPHRRFLRKRLRLKQEALSCLMGVARETVSRWESGGEMSAARDYVLRSLAVSRSWRAGKGFAQAVRDTLAFVRNEEAASDAPVLVLRAGGEAA